MPLLVTCPACGTSMPLPAVPTEGTFACVCGQRMRLARAVTNPTVLVRPEPAGDAAPGRHLYCRRCGRGVRPVFSKRMSNPWAWICAAFGLLTCLFPVAIVGSFLVQRIEKCPECDEVLRAGPTTFGY